MAVTLDTHEHGATVVVELSGWIDITSSPVVRKGLLELTERQVRTIVVNLSEVPYMDSSGIATFVECRQRLDEYGGELRLCCANRNLRDIFDVVNLSGVFSIFENQDEALG